MKQCWPEGDLRAYIDGELPADAMAAVAAHIEECSACGDHWAELAGRAKRVSALMESLGEPSAVVAGPRLVRRSVRGWMWIGAAAALAAGLAIGILRMPKREEPVAVTPPPEQILQPVQAPEPAVPAVRSAKAALTPRPRRAVPVAVQKNEPFLALDDDPIESGMVFRIEIGPRAVPADVVVDSVGRPRAIRLVSSQSNH